MLTITPRVLWFRLINIVHSSSSMHHNFLNPGTNPDCLQKNLTVKIFFSWSHQILWNRLQDLQYTWNFKLEKFASISTSIFFDLWNKCEKYKSFVPFHHQPDAISTNFNQICKFFIQIRQYQINVQKIWSSLIRFLGLDNFSNGPCTRILCVSMFLFWTKVLTGDVFQTVILCITFGKHVIS